MYFTTGLSSGRPRHEAAESYLMACLIQVGGRKSVNVDVLGVPLCQNVGLFVHFETLGLDL